MAEHDPNELIAIRDDIISSVRKIYDFVSTASITQVVAVYVKHQRLPPLVAEYAVNHRSIVVYNASCEKEEEQIVAKKDDFDDLIDAIELCVHKLKEKAQSRAAQTQDPTSNTSGSAAQSYKPKLPPIKIPIFKGSIAHWAEFNASYDSLIHSNASLNAVEKFHQLRALLEGEPLALISHFSISEPNYTLAYNKLQGRYQNERVLATHYANEFINYKSTSLYNNLPALEQYCTAHQDAIKRLGSLALADNFDFLCFHISYTHLDRKMQERFDETHAPDVIHSHEDLMKFVQTYVRSVELHQFSNMSISNRPQPAVRAVPKIARHKPSALMSRSSTATGPFNSPVIKYPCPKCGDFHFLSTCPGFAASPLQDRILFLNQHDRCHVCLGKHATSTCKSRYLCPSCKGRHHYLLHGSSMSSAGDTAPPVSLSTLQFKPLKNDHILLSTAIVYIKDASQVLHPIRALLDSCSEISAITVSCAKKLGLTISKQPSALHGIGLSPASAAGFTTFAVHSKLNPRFSVQVQAYLMNSIAGTIPSQPISHSVLDRFQHITLADPNFYTPSEVDLLLGADIYSAVLKSGPPILGELVAIPTLFGHVLMGHASKSTDAVPNVLVALQPSLEDVLQQFWRMEEPESLPISSPSDDQAELLFRTHHSRDRLGRFIVPLLFRDSSILGSNRDAALRSYVSLERRLQTKPEHYAAYFDFMTEYLQLGHMVPAASPSAYVIPHHVVHKLSSSTTKTRVVFNASALSDTGNSLNSLLFPGPKLQSDLTQILFSFRLHPVALCGDIRMMYRQILVRNADCVHQHIFWRPTPSSPVTEYELKTVTYGLTSSAFLAQRCVAQLADEHQQDFPLASFALRREIYVDDVTSGSATVKDALLLRDQLISLLALGGFELRKWMSNEPAVLRGLPDEHVEANLTFDSHDSYVKILGLSWDPISDSFKYDIEPFSPPFTKRNILSYLARTFDPMGWFTPIIIWIKCFIQRLWLNALDWDEPIPDDKSSLWRLFSRQLPLLSAIRIPRLLPQTISSPPVLIGFSDASSSAYAACVYLCSSSSNPPSCMLLQAKSRVAPLKTQSIARLELNGALLLAKLAHVILNRNPDLFSAVRLFTDSENVLHWLAGSPHQYKIYVANRVTRIQELVPDASWHYVPTQDNPADCSSRGQLPSDFSANTLWWTGPSFLLNSPSAWPSWSPTKIVSHDLEVKPVPVSLVSVSNSLLTSLSKCSNYMKLLRIFSYVFRFLNRCRGALTPEGPVSCPELQCALFNLIRLVQQESFAADFVSLRSQGSSTTRLRSLTPFIDRDFGFLRVGGRLGKSSLPYEQAHPPILPKCSFLSSLLINYYHTVHSHAGPSLVHSVIIRRFWILSARSLVRSVLHKCVRCIRFRAKPLQPLMGPLPASRVNPSPPFFTTGTDFAGPFLVKEGRRRNASCTKAYLCVFVCFSTKAVHLELVTSLSTDAFLAALDRFVSRRGLPHEIVSDCGKTFIAANRRLRDAVDFLTEHHDTLFTACSAKGIHWSFNPPYAPNFGGLFEAAVKSTKRLLYKSLGDIHYYHEELSTLFVRVEAILNSRPLASVPVDPDHNSDFLTPGHFLIGRPLLAVPEPVVDLSITPVCRWKNLRRLTQQFWSRFSSEYLNTLIPRNKWQSASVPLSLDQVVLVPDVHCTPLSWPLGRVSKIHPSSDGHVRVVTVLCRGREYVRPANKLVPLPSAS